MPKTVLLVLAGLVAGLVLAFGLRPSSEPSVEAEAASGTATVARSDVNAGLSESRLEALEDARRRTLDHHRTALFAAAHIEGQRAERVEGRPLPAARRALVVDRRAPVLLARLERLGPRGRLLRRRVGRREEEDRAHRLLAPRLAQRLLERVVRLVDVFAVDLHERSRRRP